ncbi:hypothetical protein RHRU231_230102 [Rhodococcus ruber]|uniref:Uncharacterized protein n=1 Tax=Rhodococcus ruber TaxID=1830 RepID=A0A098BEY2_9NOCA|nr:hypothetical protein RHRU231_230102 [Rhodococcus ruber]
MRRGAGRRGRAGAEGVENAPGRVLAHAHGAVDVLVALGGQVGRREEDRSDGCELVLAVAVQAAEIVARRVGPAGPLLGAPVGFVVDHRVLGLLAEITGHGREDRGLAFRGGEFEDGVGLLVRHERHQGAPRILEIGVVVDLLDERPGAEARAGQALLAPERRVVHGVHLDDEPEGLVLVHLVLAARQRRDVGDAGVQVRRHGQHGEPGVDGDPVGHRAHAPRRPGLRALGPVQGPHRISEKHVVAEPFGQPLRHLLHTADDALVEDEVLVHEVAERTRGCRHEDRLQRGERVGRLGEHAPGDEQPDVGARFLVVRVGPEPVVEGDGVEFPRPRMRPRLVGADLGGERVEQRDQLVHLDAGVLGGRERVAAVPDGPALGVEVDVLAVAVAGEGAQTQFVEEGDQGGLVGGHPLTADLEHRSVDRVGPGAAADAVAGFEDGDPQARLSQAVGGGQAGRSRPDDDDVTLDGLHGIPLRENERHSYVSHHTVTSSRREEKTLAAIRGRKS